MLRIYLLYARPLVEPDRCVSHKYKAQWAYSHIWSGTKKYTTYVAIFPFGEDFSPGRFSELSFFLHGCDNHVPLTDDIVVVHSSPLTLEPCEDLGSFFDPIVLH